MNRNITLTWQQGVHFIAEDEQKNEVHVDGSSELGGENQGMRPMMMALVGLSGCASIDIVGILNKSKQAFSAFVVEVHATRREEIPKIFSAIHLTFKLQGRLDEKRVNHAIKLSVEKYCSVAAMLNQSADITYSTEITN